MKKFKSIWLIKEDFSRREFVKKVKTNLTFAKMKIFKLNLIVFKQLNKMRIRILF